MDNGKKSKSPLFDSPKDWSNWKKMPSPENCRTIEGPLQSGVYQIRNKETGELIQFGIGTKCQKRMRSFFPKPYGTGTRNNENKRKYILTNCRILEFRTMATDSLKEAKEIEAKLKSFKNHLFNT